MNIVSELLQYIRCTGIFHIRTSLFLTPIAHIEKETLSPSLTLNSKMPSKTVSIAHESFPTVEPAFTIQVQISGKYMVGKLQIVPLQLRIKLT